MKIPGIISRILVGLVFIFSGTVKAIDPLGSAYKFHDYFQAFNVPMFGKLALPLAVILCTIEFITGFMILTGLCRKTGIWLAAIMMAIFTPLTLILAINNPVSDCGCFGDAVHLTNWQTFGKNIVLLAAVLIIFIDRKKPPNRFGPLKERFAILLFSVLFILFSLYNLRYLPVVDFLPYKKGVKIADMMTIPENAPADKYKTTFIYRKGGETREFSLEDYPANDTSWIFVDQKSVLVSKGYQPPIHDFIITDPSGDDITQKILSDTGYAMLMVTKKLREASREDLDAGTRLGRHLTGNGIKFYILTASGSDEVSAFGNILPVCTADETTLKTMIRSNPGYILIRNGRIEEKWSHSNLPGTKWFDRLNDAGSQDPG
jgi:uncharacterized membrane protein YphA (DoxX/SURF4 family)